MTGRAGINLILYPNLIIAGAGSFNVYEPVAVDKTIVHSYGVVLDDAITIQTMAYLTLGFDHRLIDGAVADAFMADIKQGLEQFDAAAM